MWTGAVGADTSDSFLIAEPLFGVFGVACLGVSSFGVDESFDDDN